MAAPADGQINDSFADVRAKAAIGQEQHRFVPGRVLVKFKNDAPANLRFDITDALGSTANHVADV